MSQHDINKSYISPSDRFFHEFDKTHTKSVSQLAEIAYHLRIAELRDHAKSNDIIET